MKLRDSPVKIRFLRGAVRLVFLLALLLVVRVRFLLLALRSRGRVSQAQRAQWLHEACSLICQCLSIGLTVEGIPPAGGLLVSNHLSYLDVLLFGGVLPCVFVSKSEVRRWPMFGALARAGGTIFVERNRGAQSAEAAASMERKMTDGLPVLLFAEGTSSDGSEVLPFRSSLFEPAIRAGVSVTPAAIGYGSSDASEARVSYWGEMVFFPHLFATLCLRDLHAAICFGEPVHFASRKNAASMTWLEVSRMRRKIAPVEMDVPEAVAEVLLS